MSRHQNRFKLRKGKQSGVRCRYVSERAARKRRRHLARKIQSSKEGRGNTTVQLIESRHISPNVESVTINQLVPLHLYNARN
jgi:hypothetical protein